MSAETSSFSSLIGRLHAYKRRYYTSRLVRGLLLLTGLLASAFVAVAALEYVGQFGTQVRTGLFFGFVAVAVGIVATYGLWPAWQLVQNDRFMTDELAARQIGAFFPEVGDKLLNLLQLRAAGASEAQARQSALVEAAMSQKTDQLRLVPFGRAVRLAENRRFVPWAVFPLGVIALLLLLLPQLLTESAGRIVNYRQAYLPKAPFNFLAEGATLTAYAGEPLRLAVRLQGRALPEQVSLRLGGQPYAMRTEIAGRFSTEITAPDASTEAVFEAAGFSSAPVRVQILHRPQLSALRVQLRYPAYTGKAPETLLGQTTLQVPAGTQIAYRLRLESTERVELRFADGRTLAARAEGEGFALDMRALKSAEYQIVLTGADGATTEPIAGRLEVLPDLSPAVELESRRDSLDANYVFLAGQMTDDYGFTSAQVLLRHGMSQGLERLPYRTLPQRLTGTGRSRTYLYELNLEQLGVKPGEEAELVVRAYDNDGVAGPKPGLSRPIRLRQASEAEQARMQSQRTQQATSAMQQSLEQARQIEKESEQARQKLVGKKTMGFQERQSLEKMAAQQEQLRDQLQQLQREVERLQKDDAHRTEQSEQIKEKAEQLQKLMADLLDEETKRLYDELQKLLAEQAAPEQIRDQLEKLESKEKNMTRELDRALELFKQLNVEKKLEESTQRLEDLAKEQLELAKGLDKTDKGDKKDKEDKGGKEKAEDKAKDQKSAEDKKSDQKSDHKPDQKAGDQKPGEDKKGDQKQGDQKASDDKKGDQKSGDDQKTGEQKSSEQKQDPAAEQKKLQEEFKQLEQDMEQMRKLNKELETPEQLPETGKQEEQIEKSQQDAAEKMQQSKKKQAAKPSKQAGEQMQQMAQQMRQAQQDSEEEQTEENAEDLRKILENLLKLSFDQEQTMREMRTVNQLDPRYLALSQDQLRLRDDAKVVEDSLNALARRVFQIQAFVTREMAEMRTRMDESVDAVKRRRQDIASGKGQLAMTSMNNLALMLSDVLAQMQQQMQQQAQGKGGGQSKKKGKGKPKPGEGSPSLSQMQQALNKQIQSLQKSGKSGRGLSEELAKMAAQQEAIRRALAELEKGKKGGKDGKGEGGSQSGGLKGQMEQTEKELVNKRLTQETILRQQQIMTRLLEAEQAMRERDQEQKRESQTARALPPPVPPSLRAYLAAKEAQVQLLKTQSPSLTSFYRQENERYFRALQALQSKPSPTRPPKTIAR